MLDLTEIARYILHYPNKQSIAVVSHTRSIMDDFGVMRISKASMELLMQTHAFNTGALLKSGMSAEDRYEWGIGHADMGECKHDLYFVYMDKVWGFETAGLKLKSCVALTVAPSSAMICNKKAEWLTATAISSMIFSLPTATHTSPRP